MTYILSAAALTVAILTALQVPAWALICAYWLMVAGYWYTKTK